MPVKTLIAFLFLLIAPGLALADVKVYDQSIEGGDFILVTNTLCPTTQVTPGIFEGSFEIDDAGTGTVTLDDYDVTSDRIVEVDLTLFSGPGAFVFVETSSTQVTSPGQTGTGSTAKSTGAVTWGVLSGFKSTGGQFCLSSPTTVCANNEFLHGATTPSVTNSPTYDLGTWSFDAAGDMEATPYIFSTGNGGLSNTQREWRGVFVGASLPALPLVGFGALALTLVVVGVRTAMRKR